MTFGSLLKLPDGSLVDVNLVGGLAISPFNTIDPATTDPLASTRADEWWVHIYVKGFDQRIEIMFGNSAEAQQFSSQVYDLREKELARVRKEESEDRDRDRKAMHKAPDGSLFDLRDVSFVRQYFLEPDFRHIVAVAIRFRDAYTTRIVHLQFDFPDVDSAKRYLESLAQDVIRAFNPDVD
jgi:hypothetical protein